MAANHAAIAGSAGPVATLRSAAMSRVLGVMRRAYARQDQDEPVLDSTVG